MQIYYKSYHDRVIYFRIIKKLESVQARDMYP